MVGCFFIRANSPVNKLLFFLEASMKVFLLGFLANSVLMRVFGKVNSDDIIYPLVLIVLVVLMLLVESKTKNNKPVQRMNR